MQIQSLALLVSEHPASVEAVRQAVTRNGLFRVQVLEKASTAAARLAGGGVSLIFLDLVEQGNGNEGFASLRVAAPDVPMIVISDPENASLAVQAVRNGAAASLRRDDSQENLEAAINALLSHLSDPPAAQQTTGDEMSATVLAFTGAKGGVGCTTVALNVATLLARRHRVILAEMSPDLSFLRQYLRPQRAARGWGPLLVCQTSPESSVEVESSLWASRSIPNLRILFGPQSAQECRPIDPRFARTLLATLSKNVDYVVLDLPHSLTESGKSLLRHCDLMGLVVERDPLCVEYAKAALQALSAADATPHELGAVVVNRSALSCPIPLSDIELSLSTSILGVVPPAADLCVSAQKAHSAVVTFDAESLMARNFANLAERVDIRPIIN